MARRWQEPAIAVSVAAVLCLQVAAPFESDALPPDWRAYALVTLIGLSMLGRRRYPVGVLLADVAILLVYYNLGFGAVGAVWPLSPALFNAALYGRWLEATAVAGSILFGSGAFRMLVEAEEATAATVSDLLAEAALGTAVILAGAMVRNHRRLSAEVDARERAVAAERDAAARERLTDQRLHIAREVHDIVAHSLAGIGVQARLAAELLDTDTEGARRALRAVTDTTGEAMTRLRETVGGMRGAPAAGQSLEELVAAVHGLDVALSVDVDSHNEKVASTIVAVVRESLTNAVRHSGATRAEVRVAGDRGRVTVDVVDDGRGGPAVEGNGIRGMRERVEGQGGILEVGPRSEGGFRVRAVIPA